MIKDQKIERKHKLFLHIGFGRTGTSSIQYIIRYLSFYNKFIYNPAGLLKVINNISHKRYFNKNYSELLNKLKIELYKNLSSYRNISHTIISLESLIRWDIGLQKNELEIVKEIIKIASEIYEISIIITHRKPSSLTRSNYLFRTAQYIDPECMQLCKIINGEMIDKFFKETNNLKQLGAKDIFFINTNKISKLDWFKNFGIKSTKGILFNKELKKIKLNTSKSIESIVITSLIWEFFKNQFVKIFANKKDSFIYRLYNIVTNKLHAILVRIVNIYAIKLLIKKIIGKNRMKIKLNQIETDLNIIEKTHLEADETYFKLFPDK